MIEKTPFHSKSSQVNRRDFFSILWQTAIGLSSLLGLTGIFKFLSYTPGPQRPTRFDLGPAGDIPSNSITIIQEAQSAIIPTTHGFEALSLVCPHLGCQVEIHGEGFECPCHGSTFRTDGGLVKGPANQPLQKLHLEHSTDGHLILDTSISEDLSHLKSSQP